MIQTIGFKAMRNTVKFIGLIAMAAVLFGCEKKTDPVTPTPKDSEEQGIDLSQFDPSEYLVSFGATIESAKTKADINLESGVVTFENGDKVIAVTDGKSSTYTYNNDKFELDTSIQDNEPLKFSTNDIQFYYPAGCFDKDGVFAMPDAAADLADLGDKAPMAAKETPAETVEVHFKNVASIFKVSLTGNKSDTRKVASVTLSNSNIPLAAAGSYTVTWNEGNPSIESTATDYSITVAPAGEIELDADTAKDFFFLLPPTATAMRDMSVTVTMDDNDTFSRSREGNLTIARNKIVSLAFRAGYFYDGDGSDSNPYQIKTADDFKQISKNAEFLSKNFIQVAEIDFNGANISKCMIGAADAPFTGTYDGGNKTLSNFTITGTPSGNEGVAPFKAVDGATLKNISISGANVTGGKFTAGLVGYANGASLMITGCSISNSTISASGDYGAGGLIGGLYAGTVSSCSGTDLTIGATNTEGNKRYYGGLISYARGTTAISACSLNGTTTVNGTPAYFGGIAGQANEDDTTISDCHNHSNISGVGNFAGGIAGIKSKGSIEGCTNDGSVGGAQYVGGIAGSNAAGNILGCTNKGAIVSTGIAGGIAGQVTGGTIKDCTNESSATFSVSGATVGGIAGTLTGGTITASDGKYTENKADIDLGVVEGNNNVGGIVGQLEGAITNVKNSGAITGYYNIGGIGGTITTNGSVENALSSGNVSGYQNVGGISGKHGHNANAAITKKITLKNCHVDGADITASANDGRAGGIAGLVFAGSWIEGCTAFRGTVSGHQDVGGAIGHLQYASSSTDKSNRIFVGANLVSMNVSGLTPINNTSRIGGFIGYFQNNKDAYTFAYQNGVVGGSITAEGCQYVGSFVGYASVSSNKGRIWDSYSLIEDSNFHVTTTNANIGGFAGGYGNANVNSVRNAHVNSQNTSAATSGITATTVANIRTVNLGTTESPSCNVDGSAYTTTTWSNPDDVNYPVPTILVTYGNYK